MSKKLCPAGGITRLFFMEEYFCQINRELCPYRGNPYDESDKNKCKSYTIPKRFLLYVLKKRGMEPTIENTYGNK